MQLEEQLWHPPNELQGDVGFERKSETFWLLGSLYEKLETCHHLCRWRHRKFIKEKMKNPTLTKNMKHVKWKAIPPLKGPDPEGLRKVKEQDTKKLESLNGRYR